MSYRFFQNRECEYFPCHSIGDKDIAEFNCLFCYCPLHFRADCGGKYVILKNGWKDCSHCLSPHFEYDRIISKLCMDVHNSTNDDLNQS